MFIKLFYMLTVLLLTRHYALTKLEIYLATYCNITCTDEYKRCTFAIRFCYNKVYFKHVPFCLLYETYFQNYIHV